MIIQMALTAAGYTDFEVAETTRFNGFNGKAGYTADQANKFLDG